MPKTSLTGSMFPQLEQDQRSTPHTDRRPAGRQVDSGAEKNGENSQKQKKTKGDER